MKKSSIVLFAIAGLFFVCSLPFLSSGEFGSLICGLVIAAVIAFVGLRQQRKHMARIKKERLDAEAERVENERIAEVRRRYAETHKSISFSVAGVTFKNDDRKSRQAILKRKMKESKELPIVVSLGQYEYEGKPAVAVLLDDEQVGSVPKEYLPEVLPLFTEGKKLSLISCDIDNFKDEDEKTIYYCDVHMSLEI